MNTWLTSDLHLQHLNIIKYCDRPFPDVPTMNEAIIANWNARVQPDDQVLIVGDVVMGQKENIPALMTRLMGKKTLIKGNHDLDRKGNLLKQYAQTDIVIVDELYTEIDGIKVYLRHIPKMDFVPDERAQYHLCGHVHSSWVRQGLIENVGVDVCDYKPMTLAEILARPQKIGPAHREEGNMYTKDI